VRIAPSLVSLLLVVLCLPLLAAEADWTVSFDFERQHPNLQLHNGARIVEEGGNRFLRLVPQKNQYASFEIPADITRGVRLEARVRLDPNLKKFGGSMCPLGQNGVCMMYFNATRHLWALFWPTNGQMMTVQAVDSITPGRWVNAVVEYHTGGYAMLWLNGVSQARVPVPLPLQASKKPFVLGRYEYVERGTPGVVFFPGDIDDVKVAPPSEATAPGSGRKLARRNAIRISWGDHIAIFKAGARLNTPERIERAVKFWHDECGVDRVYWRVSHEFIMDYCKRIEGKSFEWYRKASSDIEGDPLEAITTFSHKYGLKVYAYHTIFDEGCPPEVLYGGTSPFPWQSKFTIQHPEYLVVDRTGKKRQWGVMAYAYPQVRKYMIGVIMDFLERYPFDGVYISSRTHSPGPEFADQYGFNDPIVEEYKRRYGVDIRQRDFDLEKWRRLRGEYLTRFLRELRRAVGDRKICMAIPRGDHIGPPFGNMYLDWRTWVAKGLVDELVIGMTTGSGHYPPPYAYGYINNSDFGIGMNPLEYDIREVYGPVCKQHGAKLFAPRSSVGSDKDKELINLGLSALMLRGELFTPDT